jgi:transcriptional regulator with XRE-family HTH domain
MYNILTLVFIMAKSELKIRAREMRRRGKSVRDIANKLGVSKGSASLWCRDIELTKGQIRNLELLQQKGSYIGRLRGAETQKKKRLDEIEHLRTIGIKEVPKLNEGEFFVSGIALYWGEGLKTGHRCGVSNSDPKAILFMLDWFEEYCKADIGDFICQVGINMSHEGRIEEVERYWSKITKIPLSQFIKASIKKVRSKKIYDNHDHHFGTLRLEMRKSSKMLRKILGWIEGLYLGRE